MTRPMPPYRVGDFDLVMATGDDHRPGDAVTGGDHEAAHATPKWLSLERCMAEGAPE